MVIAFIGGGNMAASLIGGLLAAGRAPATLQVAEVAAQRREQLAQRFGIAVHASAREAVAGAGAVVLAVKPQQMRAALDGLELPVGTLVLSIAAGLRLDSLRRALGSGPHYVRSMPNTPALLNAGVSGLYAEPSVPTAARDCAQAILAACGDTVWVDSEAQLDAVTALSGSGPAYYFLLTEALARAGAGLGLAPEIAARLARQTFIGAARMAADDADVRALRARVTSPGGTTEAAVRVLEQRDLPALFADALAAAAARGAELGETLDREF